MQGVYVFLGVIGYMVLVFLASLRIPRPSLSEFELRRRKELGDGSASFGLKRLAALPRLMSLQHVLLWIIGLSASWAMIAGLGWGYGTLASIVAIALLGPISRIGLLRQLVQRSYRKVELRVMKATRALKGPLKLFAPELDMPRTTLGPESREELTHLLGQSRRLLSEDEAQLFTHALDFYNTRVDAIMTPISKVVTIEANEVLGPLVISNLHKTGHTQFPVINSDDVVGLLDITDSVSLRRRESPEARDVMRHDMARVRGDEPLDEVLRVLIDVKQPCLLVTNEDDEISGLVSIGDVVRALTGWNTRGR